MSRRASHGALVAAPDDRMSEAEPFRDSALALSAHGAREDEICVATCGVPKGAAKERELSVWREPRRDVEAGSFVSDGCHVGKSLLPPRDQASLAYGLAR